MSFFIANSFHFLQKKRNFLCTFFWVPSFSKNQIEKPSKQCIWGGCRGLGAIFRRFSFLGVETSFTSNFIIFSKNKKSKPGIIQFSEVNLKIFDDEEREIQNLIGWTN